jgi:predicted lysophospholipase L1 biosynthesis ABC-type transport system permease subunit
VVVEGTEASAYAIEQRKGRQHFTVIDGREPRTASEAALGGDLMDRLGKRVGDPVALAGARRPFRIVGTVVTPSQDQDPLAAGVVLTPAALEAAKQSEGEGQTIVTWRRGQDAAAAERRLRADFPMSISAYSHPRVPGEVVNLDRASALPLAFGGFLAIVGIAALAHALFTSARRHRHGLAVLRTLGFVRPQVAGALTWQATTIAAVGLALGLPLGVAVGRWIWVLVAEGVGVATDPRIPIATGGLVLSGALLVANLVGWPLGLRAARAAPAEVLRTE